jgi:tripartite-type tricarboxylate transporter receptor subunit TctC
MSRRSLLCAGLCTTALQLMGVAHAQEVFPARAIRVIVPFIPGSAPDTFARVVGERMAALLGKPVVVENKPGATSMIGTDAVAHAPADGYTLLIATPSTTIMAASGRKLNFNPVKDLMSISMGIRMSPLLITSANSPIKDLKTLIAMAKAKPGKMVIASGGIGNSQHLAAEMLKQMAGIDMLHVPYQGTPAVVPALINGEIDLTFADASALSLIKSGKVRAIAVGSPNRSKAVPEVPTIAESGLPGFNYQSWYGFMAPGGTPASTIAILNRAINKALAEPDVKSRLTEAGMEPAPGTPEAMDAFMAEEIKRWGSVIQTAKIKFE